MLKFLQISLVVISVALGFILNPTFAHKFYSPYCCDEKDCEPVPCEQLVETDKGDVEYTVNGFKYTAPKERVYPSEDKQCHFCAYKGQGRCAYIQQGS